MKSRIILNAAGCLIIIILLVVLIVKYVFSIDVSETMIASVLIQIASIAVIVGFCFWAVKKHLSICDSKKLSTESKFDTTMLILCTISTILLMIIYTIGKSDLCMFMAMSLLIVIAMMNIIADQPSKIFQIMLVIGMLIIHILQIGYLAYDEACTKMFHMKLDKSSS
ncbi:hypothetical protein CWI42_070690 [Ordospora colligata]|nr:hypothetical protein CWI40_070680 [Ordospora colligata]TBU18497.1 hypothetical protein CWI42_070690 [Ordospora colligata]